MSKNRYAGISPFTKEQEDIFFGRERDITELYEQIRLEKQVLLYAKSGIGKSSLLHAGVTPKLIKDEQFTPINIRFRAYTESNFSTPLQRIFEALADLNDPQPETESVLQQIASPAHKQRLWYAFKNRELNPNCKAAILIFDQFEELFSYPAEQVEDFKIQLSELLSGEVPPHFVDLFAQARSQNRELMNRQTMRLLNQSIDIKMVYIIRSDRLSQLNLLRDRIPNIQKSYYELLPLNAKQAHEAISEPAKKDGEFSSPKFSYLPEAIDKIVSFLTKNNTQIVETTQLQIICQRIEQTVINKKLNGFEKFVVTEQDIPDFKNIFFSFYNDALLLITEKYRTEARNLVENELIRNLQRISLDGNICIEYLPDAELQKLVDAHLLRGERNSVGGFSYELSHDTLIEPIHEAAEKRRAQEEEARAEAERQEELRQAHEKAEKERIEREKERKRQRKVILMVGSVAVVALIAFVVSIVFFFDAKEATEKAVNNEKKALKSLRENDSLQINKLVINANSLISFNENELAIMNLREALKIDTMLSIQTMNTYLKIDTTKKELTDFSKEIEKIKKQ